MSNKPDYKVYARISNGTYLPVGGAWEKTSQTGRHYISLKIDLQPVDRLFEGNFVLHPYEEDYLDPSTDKSRPKSKDKTAKKPTVPRRNGQRPGRGSKSSGRTGVFDDEIPFGDGPIS